MKKIVFLLLFIPTLCFAQNKKSLSHFWDIPWGVSMERAKAIFGERDFPFMQNENCLMAMASYEGEDALIMLLFNRANRFYSGNVIYTSTEDTAISKYNNYRLVLFRRYGTPDTVAEYFNSPYEEGDGREIEAIITNNAIYLTQWNFLDNCQASVEILNSLDICLSFTNPVYGDSASGQR